MVSTLVEFPAGALVGTTASPVELVVSASLELAIFVELVTKLLATELVTELSTELVVEIVLEIVVELVAEAVVELVGSSLLVVSCLNKVVEVVVLVEDAFVVVGPGSSLFVDDSAVVSSSLVELAVCVTRGFSNKVGMAPKLVGVTLDEVGVTTVPVGFSLDGLGVTTTLVDPSLDELEATTTLVGSIPDELVEISTVARSFPLVELSGEISMIVGWTLVELDTGSALGVVVD